MSYQVKTPIIFSIFHRPEWARQVFERIREARPKQLYIFADGPRTNRPGEAEACEAARKLVEHIDWDCEVIRDYSDVNLGNKKRIYSGLDEAFKRYERAIFLEHDCLPDPSFFQFMDEMLDRYEQDQRIMLIAGFNSLDSLDLPDSYLFAKHGDNWGWATWRDRWKSHDPLMSNWPYERKKKDPFKGFLDQRETAIFKLFFDKVCFDGYDCWDYPWDYSRFIQHKLFITPTQSLVTNIGFDPKAENTRDLGHALNQVKTHSLSFPLKHPKEVKRNLEFEARYFDVVIKLPAWQVPWMRFKRMVKKALGKTG